MSIIDFTFGFVKRLKSYEINVITSDGMKSNERYLDLLEKDLPCAKVENHFRYIQILPIHLPDENVENDLQKQNRRLAVYNLAWSNKKVRVGIGE